MARLSLGVALFGALVITGAGIGSAAGDDRLSLAPLHPGERANYELSFVGKFGGPKDEIADDHFSIARGDHDAAQIALGGPKPDSAAGVVAADGTIAVDPSATVSDLVVDYNSVVAIAHAAPPHPAPGTTWHAVIPVRTSPKSWAKVPVDITVSAANGTTTTLTATGTKNDILYYNGFTMPVDVSAKLSATFDRAKHFTSATFSDRETVQNITVSYTWRLNDETAPK